MKIALALNSYTIIIINKCIRGKEGAASIIMAASFCMVCFNGKESKMDHITDVVWSF